MPTMKQAGFTGEGFDAEEEEEKDGRMSETEE
jgi:hypothetical protein